MPSTPSTPRSSAAVSFLAALVIGGAAHGGAFETYVDTFDLGLNEGGWTWGFGDAIAGSGGNPGPFLQTTGLDTFAPQPRTTVGGIFIGDYRAKGVTSIGIDLATFAVDFSADGRPLALMLITDNGTPGDPFDDTAAYVLGPNVPRPGTGWHAYDFDVPSQLTELPAGWLLLNLGDSGAPANHTWNEVIEAVTEVRFFYGDPTFFFIFQQWSLGLDNARITQAGSTLGKCCFDGIVPPPLCAVTTEAECGFYVGGVWTPGQDCSEPCDEPDMTPPTIDCAVGAAGGANEISVHFDVSGSGPLVIEAAIDIGCDVVPVESGQVVDLTCNPVPAPSPRTGGPGEPAGDGAAGGMGGDLVTICHVPPGNPGAAHTIQVAASAVRAHLAHGDTLGPCEDGPPCSWAYAGDVLVIDAPQAILQAVVTDVAGNQASCEIDLCQYVVVAPPCPADLDGSRTVDLADLGALVRAWGRAGDAEPADVDRDGVVGAEDLVRLLQAWGRCD